MRNKWVPVLMCCGSIATAANMCVFQYDAAGFNVNGGVAAWTAANGKSALVAARPDWEAPCRVGRVVRFDDASPMEFSGDSATNTIAYAVAVVTCDAGHDAGTGLIHNTTNFNYSTLIDAPGAVRFTANEEDAAALAFSQSQLSGEVAVNVDTEESPLFFPAGVPLPAQTLHLVEAAFALPPAASRIFVGGSPAAPEWNRSWKGGVADIVFFTEPPSEKERECVLFFLKVKWQLPVFAEPHADALAVLRALGMNPGDVFTSVIFVR